MEFTVGSLPLSMMANTGMPQYRQRHWSPNWNPGPVSNKVQEKKKKLPHQILFPHYIAANRENGKCTLVSGVNTLVSPSSL